MRWIFRAFGYALCVTAVVFAAGGVWVMASGEIAAGGVVALCGAASAILAAGCFASADRSPLVVKLPPSRR